MNTEIVTEAARAALSGSIPFPEVVRRLIETGVEYYHVDYAALRMTFCSATRDTVTTPISYEGLPSVAADFDAPPELRAAILDSQRHGQHFWDFTRRAMEVGVQGYIAFLRGQRVAYWVAEATSIPSGFRSRPEFQMTSTPNHALQRTRCERRGCNRCIPCAGSLSMGR